MCARFIIKGKIVVIGKGDIRGQSSKLLKLLVIEDSASALTGSIGLNNSGINEDIMK